MVSKLISETIWGPLGMMCMMCVHVCMYACGTQASAMTPFLLPNKYLDNYEFADDSSLY